MTKVHTTPKNVSTLDIQRKRCLLKIENNILIVMLLENFKRLKKKLMFTAINQWV